ncbi:MAG: serine protein kinase RIO [Candidatus Thermoplasmatota archaeon]
MCSEFNIDDKWLKKLDRATERLLDRTGIDRKTFDRVFDNPTLLNLGKLISDRVIDIIDFPISSGKEAYIFRGVTPEKKFIAVKIYRTSTMIFNRISEYIIGDPRFKSLMKNRREIIFEWVKKEYKNLELLKSINIRAPTPIKRIDNILVMGYIGDAYKPASMLKDTPIKEPRKIFETLIIYVGSMYKAGLVHADLSEYNVLIYRQRPYLIDLGQGVMLEHPRSQEFLRRDISNIVRYFKRYDIDADTDEIFNRIIKKKSEKGYEIS